MARSYPLPSNPWYVATEEVVFDLKIIAREAVNQVAGPAASSSAHVGVFVPVTLQLRNRLRGPILRQGDSDAVR